MFRNLFKEEERRIDPEDGVLRTKAELQAACAGVYTPEEIEQYWNVQCKPPGSPEAAGEAHSVANDPFLTHMKAQDRRQAPAPAGSASPPTAPAGSADGQADLRSNPFLTGGMQQQGPALRSDPFLTHNNQSQARPTAPGQGPAWLDQATAGAQRNMKHWTEVAARTLGEGDPDRKPAARTIFVWVPWVLFVWTELVWVLLRHFSVQAAAVLSIILYGASLGLVVAWQLGKRWGPVSLLSLGVLSLLACTAGTMVGELGWDHYWRLNWWMRTGIRSDRNSATTPAGARVDAATVGFWDDAIGRTVNDTSVDSFKSAGYKDGHYYCVAPILSPDSAGAGLAEVNFWAIGIDCCQYLGSFTCDDSRNIKGGYGVVMLDHGMPCPGCDGEKFRKAMLKAETMHGLVSAPGAMFVRWVASPSQVTTPLMLKSVFFIIISSLLAFLVFNLLGLITWYYGLGKREINAESLLSGARLWAKQAV